MEKNRIRPVTVGKSTRMSFSRQKEVLEMPNLIEVQKDSYQWFLDDGLKEVFADISPITDYSGQLSLEFVDFKLCAETENSIASKPNNIQPRSMNGFAVPLEERNVPARVPGQSAEAASPKAKPGASGIARYKSHRVMGIVRFRAN